MKVADILSQNGPRRVVSIRDLRSAAIDHPQFEYEAMKEVLTATGVSVYVPPAE